MSITDKKLVPLVLKYVLARALNISRILICGHRYLRLHEKRFSTLDHLKRVNHQKGRHGTLFVLPD